jgi:hypothetical protein
MDYYINRLKSLPPYVAYLTPSDYPFIQDGLDLCQKLLYERRDLNAVAEFYSLLEGGTEQSPYAFGGNGAKPLCLRRVS